MVLFSADNTSSTLSIQEKITYYEVVCSISRRRLAVERMNWRGDLSLELMQLLRVTISAWEQHVISTVSKTSGMFCYLVDASTDLFRVLNVSRQVSDLDPILRQELAVADGIGILKHLTECIFPLVDDNFRVVNHENSNDLSMYDEDSINDLRDAAYSLASSLRKNNRSSDQTPATLLTQEERVQRLPLSLSFNTDNATDKTTILFQQIPRRQSSQVDVGFVMWPSAVLLAIHIIKHPLLIQNATVLELGSGCGLTGLVAAAIGAKSVVQTDYNDIVLENLKANALLNIDVTCTVTASKLDFYLQSGDSVSGGWYETCSNEKDTSSNFKIRKEPVSVVLAADVICKPTDAIAVSKTIFDCLVPGGKAYVLCGNVKHRFGVEMFEGACQNIGLRVTTTVLSSDDIDNNKANDDSRGIDSLLNFCSGYVKEMNFLLFELTKPSTLDTNRIKK